MTTDSLKDLFIVSRGKPIFIGDDTVIQMDQVSIPPHSKVTIKFVGDRVFSNNAAVIAIAKPGEIFLSDGKPVTAVATWDDESLPREASYLVDTNGKPIQIYNKYRIIHSKDFVTEDSFTGNAGIVVKESGSNRRLYQCSNGLGNFSKDDLVFELKWESQ